MENIKIDNSIAQTKETQGKISPDMALDLLMAGNARFTNNEPINRDVMQQVKDTQKVQAPFAAILCCIDSRAAAEIIFDQSIGDIFTARVAGNFVNTDILGSIEYATEVVFSKLVMVVGHTGCGAVKSACIGIEGLGNISPMLANITDAVEEVEKEMTNDPEEAAFTNKVANVNVRMTIEKMMKDSALIAARAANPALLKVAGAMYNVATGEVELSHQYNAETGKVDSIVK